MQNRKNAKVIKGLENFKAKNHLNDFIFRKLSSFGQSLLEYALVLAVVAAAFTAMSMYIQRGATANLSKMQQKVGPDSATHFPALSILEWW